MLVPVEYFYQVQMSDLQGFAALPTAIYCVLISEKETREKRGVNSAFNEAEQTCQRKGLVNYDQLNRFIRIIIILRAGTAFFP